MGRLTDLRGAPEYDNIHALLRAINDDPRRSSVPRTDRTLRVHHPWAWTTWHGAPIQPSDPDVDDRRSEPRPISTVDVEWGLVLHAVHQALNHARPDPRAPFKHEYVDAWIPYGLSDLEYTLAQEWIGEHAPVAVTLDPKDSIERPAVFDGRHRLWLTRHYQATAGAPVLIDPLRMIGRFINGDSEARSLAPYIRQDLEAAASWWIACTDPSTNGLGDSPQLRMTASAVLELTHPKPLPSRWFNHWASWDDHILRLAELHEAGRTDKSLLEDTLVSAWRNKQDSHHVDPTTLRSMFQSLGFTVNGIPAKQPRHTLLTLYRGATHEGRRGPSWTANPAVARHFAWIRQDLGAQAAVWKITVPSSRVLAVIADEEECILDDIDDIDVAIAPRHSSTPDKRTQAWIKRTARKGCHSIRYPKLGTRAETAWRKTS